MDISGLKNKVTSITIIAYFSIVISTFILQNELT